LKLCAEKKDSPPRLVCPDRRSSYRVFKPKKANNRKTRKRIFGHDMEWPRSIQLSLIETRRDFFRRLARSLQIFEHLGICKFALAAPGPDLGLFRFQSLDRFLMEHDLLIYFSLTVFRSSEKALGFRCFLNVIDPGFAHSENDEIREHAAEVEYPLLRCGLGLIHGKERAHHKFHSIAFQNITQKTYEFFLTTTHNIFP
jgi:hypothetical protein